MATGVVILINTKKKISEEELEMLRDKFLKDMGLTSDDFFDFPTSRPLLKVTNKDYEIIPPNESEYDWFDVNFYRAYYEVGYERGDIELYVKCAKWFEENIQNCEVYYGNDVNGNSLVLFNKDYRERLLEHFHRQLKTAHTKTLNH